MARRPSVHRRPPRREITDTVHETYRELEEAGEQAVDRANALEDHTASTYSDQPSEQRRAYGVLDEHDLGEDILPDSRAHRRIDQILAEYESQALRDVQSSYRPVTQELEARQRRREKRVQERQEQRELQRVFSDGWDDRKAVEYLYGDTESGKPEDCMARTQDKSSRPLSARTTIDQWSRITSTKYLCSQTQSAVSKGLGPYPVRNSDVPSPWYNISARPTCRQGFREKMRKGK